MGSGWAASAIKAPWLPRVTITLPGPERSKFPAAWRASCGERISIPAMKAASCSLGMSTSTFLSNSGARCWAGAGFKTTRAPALRASSAAVTMVSMGVSSGMTTRSMRSSCAKAAATSVGGQGEVGSGGDGDAVLPLGVHLDQGDAGGRVRVNTHETSVDPFRAGYGQELVAEGIGADAADHGDFAAQTGSGHSLVCAFAARKSGEHPAQERLARPRDGGHAHHQIHVEAADHDDSGHGAPSILCRMGAGWQT